MAKLMILTLNNDPTKEFGSEHIGGQAKYVLEISKQLLYFDWDIDIYTIGDIKSKKTEKVFNSINIYRFYRNHDNYNYDINIREINQISNNIVDFINKKELIYDAVLSCYWLSGLVGINIKKTYNIPVVIFFASLGVYKKIVEDSVCVNDRIKHEKEIAKNADKIIACSKSEKKTIVAHYDIDESKVVIIPQGIDPRIFHP